MIKTMESEYVAIDQRFSGEKGLRQACRDVREQLMWLEHDSLYMCFFRRDATTQKPQWWEKSSAGINGPI